MEVVTRDTETKATDLLSQSQTSAAGYIDSTSGKGMLESLSSRSGGGLDGGSQHGELDDGSLFKKTCYGGCWDCWSCGRDHQRWPCTTSRGRARIATMCGISSGVPEAKIMMYI